MTETAKQEKVNQESKQEQRYYYTVMEEQEGMRLDQFLAAELKEHSRSYIQKLIKDTVFVWTMPLRSVFLH